MNTPALPKAEAVRRRFRQVARPLSYALLGFVLFQWFGRSNSGPKEGSAAAEFSLALAAQPTERVSLASMRGKPAVIEVFASWCKACRSMAPAMADLANASRNREVRFLGVALDTPAEEAARLHESWGIPYSVALADDSFASNYDVKVLPTLIVIDAEGRVRHVTTGTTRAAKIEGWLEELGAARVR